MIPKNKFSRFISEKNVFIFLFFFTIIYFFYLLSENYLYLMHGDMSQRILLSYKNSNNLLSYLFNKNQLKAYWPPGHSVLHGVLIKLLSFFSHNVVVHIKLFISMSISVWFISTYLWIQTIRKLFKDDYIPYIIGISLIGNPLLLEFGWDTMSETYYVFFASLVMFLFAKYLSSNKTIYLWLSALFLLINSTFRYEAITLAFSLSIFLLFKKKYLYSVLYSLFSCSFFVAKVLYVEIFEKDAPVFFFSWGKNYDWGGGWPTLQRLIDYFIKNWGGYNIYLPLLFIAVVFFLIHIYNRTRQRKSIEKYWENYFLFFLVFIISISGLAYSILIRNVNDQLRYTIFTSIQIVYMSILGMYLNFNKSWRDNIFLKKAILLGVFALSVISIFNYHPIEESRETLEVVRWINLNKSKTETVAFDFLLSRETQLMLYTLPDYPFTNNSFSYAYIPRLKHKLPNHLCNKDLKLNGERITAYLHFYIDEYKPRYIVMSYKKLTGQIEKAKLIGYHHRKSYLKPYLKESGRKIFIQSPYIDLRNVSMIAVSQNDMYELFEVFYE